jgi:hypothetical protein
MTSCFKRQNQNFWIKQGTEIKKDTEKQMNVNIDLKGRKFKQNITISM